MSWGVPKIGAVPTPVASGNYTLTEPNGIAQGDLMIACIAYRGNAAFSVPGTGSWSIVATQQSSGDTDATWGIASGIMAWCIRGASPPGLTFTRTNGDVAIGCIIAYSGAATSSQYDTGTANTLAVASNTVTTGTFNTAGAGELIVAMCAGGDNVSFNTFDAATDPATDSGSTVDTTTAPTAGTWLLRADGGGGVGNYGTGTGADCAVGIGDAIRATAGGTGQIQATANLTASRHVMIAGAWKPGASPVSVTPGVGAATLAGFAPTAAAPRAVSPGVGAGTATGFAPTVLVATINLTVTATVKEGVTTRWTGEIVLEPSDTTATDYSTEWTTGEIGAVTDWSALTVEITADGSSTALVLENVYLDLTVIPIELTPGVGALVGAGFAPSAVVSASVGVTPGLGVTSLEGFTPTVAAPRLVTAGLGEGSFTGLAPTVATPRAIVPGLGTATLAGVAPGVATPIGITPGVASGSLAGLVPTIATPVQLTPGLGALALAGGAPSVAAGASASPGVGLAALTGFVPSVAVTNHVAVTPALGLVDLAGFPPAIALPVGVVPALGILTAEGFVPTAAIGMPPTAVAVPIADVSNTNWETELGATTGLWDSVNEGAIYDDGDYIVTTASTATVEFTIGPMLAAPEQISIRVKGT